MHMQYFTIQMLIIKYKQNEYNIHVNENYTMQMDNYTIFHYSSFNTMQMKIIEYK